MSEKNIVMLALFVESTIGGYLTVLWGGSVALFYSVLLTAWLVGTFPTKP